MKVKEGPRSSRTPREVEPVKMAHLFRGVEVLKAQRREFPVTAVCGTVCEEVGPLPPGCTRCAMCLEVAAEIRAPL